LIRNRWRRFAIGAFLLAMAINTVAFMHAWRMTHFVPGASPHGVKEMSLAGRLGTLITGIKVPRPANTGTPADFELKYSTHTFKTTDGTSVEAWLIEPDHAEPPKGLVILFHGFATCKASLLGEAKEFHKLGYDTLLVDFRGGGGSSGNASTVGFLEANEVVAAVDFARKQVAPRQLILYGQSMGAVAILRAIAKNNVQPDALILECPFDRMLTTIRHRFEWMHVPSFGTSHLLLFWGGAQHGYWAFGHNPIEYAAAVQCPALLISGGDDPWVLPDEARAVATRMHGPTRYVTIPKVGHEGAFPRSPDRWRGETAPFLIELSAQPVAGGGR
jgi:alpha-beta hydrolase superfamily lysophospholipase